MTVFTKLLVSLSLASLTLLSTGPQAVGAVSVVPHGAGVARSHHGHQPEVIARSEAESESDSDLVARSPEPSGDVELEARSDDIEKRACHHKAQLGWTYTADDKWLHKYVTKCTTIVYTWGAYKPDVNLNALHLNFACMLWGPASGKLNAFRKHRAASKYLMGFNEANQSGQANIGASAACKMYRNEITKYGAGKTLISPSVDQTPAGFTWLHNFFSCCKDCKITVLSVHWYGTSAAAFETQMKKYHQQFPGYKIWVTEFACQNYGGGNQQCSQQGTYDFMKTVTAWMDNQSWIQYYFAFAYKTQMGHLSYVNKLLDGSGNPTKLSHVYLQN